jgi:hypothetical protein
MLQKFIPLVVLVSLSINTTYAQNNIGVHGLVGVNLISQQISPNAMGAQSTNKIDIELADVELNITFKSSDEYDASIVIIKEDEKVITDEAVLNYHGSGFDLSAGKMVVPFGAFETGMISDPLTLEFSELNTNALLFSQSLDNGIDLSAYVFNGSYNGNDKELGDANAENSGLNNFGFSINYINEKLGLGLGFDYMNSIAEGEGFTEGAGTSSFNGAYAIRLNYNFSQYIKGLSFSVEHITAVGEFDDGASMTFVDDKGEAFKPSLTHIELNYGHTAFGKEANFTISSSSTDYELGDNPDRNKSSQIGFAWSINLAEGVGFAIEVLNKKDHNGDKTDTTTLQWSHEF